MNRANNAHGGRSRRARRAMLHAAPVRVHTLALAGELGHDTAVTLEAAMDDLCAAGVERLVIDMTDLTAIDRTGIDVIVLRCDLCGRHGVIVDLVGAAPGIFAAFESAGRAERLPFRENVLVSSMT